MSDLEMILAAARAAEATAVKSTRLRDEYRGKVLALLSLVTPHALTDDGYAALYRAWCELQRIKFWGGESPLNYRVHSIVSAINTQRSALALSKSAAADARAVAKAFGVEVPTACDEQPGAPQIVSEYEAAVREYADAHQARKNHSESREDSVPLWQWLSRRDELNDRVSSALRRMQELGRSK